MVAPAMVKRPVQQKGPAPRPAVARRPVPPRPPARNGMQGAMGNAATARTLTASPAASLRTGGLQDGLGNSTVAAMLGAPATERVKNPHEGGPLGWVRSGLSAVGGFLADQGWALLRRTAPELEPILRKGVREWLGEQLTGALGWLLDKLTAPVRAVSGAADTLNQLFKRMVNWMRVGMAKLVTTSCKLISDGSEQVVKVVDGIEDAEQTGLRKLKDVAGDAGDFLGGLWDKLGEPVANLLGRAGSEAWARIQQFGQWLWDKTEPIRDAGSMAWNWLKDIIGIGSGADGRNGIIQWVQARAEGVWTWVKSKLGPIPAPLKVAGGALLLLSPAGPLLAAGALAFGVVKGAKWLWNNLRDPDSLARMRNILVEEVLPQLRSSVGAVKDFINNGVAWLGDTLSTVSEGLRGLADTITAPVLAPLSDLVGWLQEQNDKLVRWVDEHAKPLAALISDALKRLHDLGGQLLEVLKKVIIAVVNPFGIAGLVMGAVWQALPACMRSAILKFLLRLVQGALRLMPAPTLGPLGAVIREALIGFVDRALEERSLAQLEQIANRFARLATKGSWDFTVGYGLGLVKGVWEGIAGPFLLLKDIVSLIGNAVSWVRDLVVTALTPPGRLLVQEIKSAWETIKTEIRPAIAAFVEGPIDPKRIFTFISGVMDEIASTARAAGASVFDKLMGFLKQPDRKLGESIGYVTGIIVFEVTLMVLTAGGSAAKPIIQNLSKAFAKAMTKVDDLLRQLRSLRPRAEKILDRVVEFASRSRAVKRVVDAAKKLFNKLLDLLRLMERGSDRPPVRTRPGDRRPRKPKRDKDGPDAFTIDRRTSVGREAHVIRATVRGRRASIQMASGSFAKFVEKFDVLKGTARLARQEGRGDWARDAEVHLEKMQTRANQAIDAVTRTRSEARQKKVMRRALRRLDRMLRDMGTELDIPGLNARPKRHGTRAGNVDRFGRATWYTGDPITWWSNNEGSRASIYIPGRHLKEAGNLERGHLLAKVLGGKGNEPENLYPILEATNDRMRGPESEADNFVRRGNDITNHIVYTTTITQAFDVGDYQTWLENNFANVDASAAVKLFNELRTNRRHIPDGTVRMAMGTVRRSDAELALVRNGLVYYFLRADITIQITSTPGPLNTAARPTGRSPVTNRIPRP
jgi:hypothetical protein